MRLKGGKVLLDLTSSGDVYEGAGITDVTLSNEELKAILEKGLIYKILYKGIVLCNEFVIDDYQVSETTFVLSQELRLNGNSWLQFQVDILNSKIMIAEV